MINEYIDDDIIMSNDMIKDLYELSQNLKDKSITNDDVVEMYGLLANYGILDNSIDRMNKFYHDIFEKDYDGILRDNPFVIPAHRVTKFMNNQYENIQTEEEIAGNGAFLANRLAKIPWVITNIPRGYKDSMLGWNKQKTEIMEKLFRVYQADEKKYMDFPKDIELDDKNNIIDYNREKYEDVKSAYDDYYKFRIWYNEKIKGILGSYPNAQKKDYMNTNLPTIQKYFRLKECEAVFYQTKNMCIKNAIELSQNGKIKVFDGTKNDSKKNDENVLLYIELPEYNAPILTHVKKEMYEKEILKGIPEDKVPAEKTIKYSGYPYWNFRLNSEQQKMVKSISPNTLKEGVFCDTITYMQNSIYFKVRLGELEKRKKMKIEPVEEVKEIKGEKGKRTLKKRKSNEEFINEDIIPVVEEKLGKSLPQAYVKGLKECPKNNNLNYVYNTIKDFLSANMTGKSEKEIADETAKMFAYMKLGQRSFWSGCNGKKDRQELYTQISKEYNEGFEKIGEAIKNKTDIKELPKIVKPKRKIVKSKENAEVILVPKVEEKKKAKEEVKEKEESNPVEKSVAKEETRKEDANADRLIEDEFEVSSDDISQKINAQNQKNSKLAKVIMHQQEHIELQTQLIDGKREYAKLLKNAIEKKKIIKQNEKTIKEQGEDINRLEQELLKDGEEK
ncbi:MAG: hypothetical protein K6B70_03930 [Clostridia bacterium]|nr:hypothetical protein [Clostridia bacterium]